MLAVPLSINETNAGYAYRHLAEGIGGSKMTPATGK